MTDRRDLAAHLHFFEELGVRGVSRDPVWRARATSASGSQPIDAPGLMPNENDAVAADQPGAEPGEAETREDLAAIRQHLGDCTRCKLHPSRTNIVFGVGHPQAQLMFVGEAPGADEDLQGEPFVGRAGQLLTKIIQSIGLERADVYIANVIKCRPPGNRNPEPDEVAQCRPFLFRQIDAIRPRVIVALGTHAAHALLEIDTPISRLRGHVIPFRHGARVVPTFHPAYLLRSPERKRDVWEDMKKVRDLLARTD